MHYRRQPQKSGLHQNWMRDYDPTTGRYIEPDPLGLVDGASVYGYARQNPGRWVDPKGELVAALCLNPGGAIVCRAITQKVAQACVEGAVIVGLAIYDWWNDEDDQTCESCSESRGYPPGFLPGDKGAEEWGRKNGYGSKEGRRKFHDLKGGNKGSGASEDFDVNPETGKVIDGNGESAGNLNDED